LTLNETSKRVLQAFKKTLGDHEKNTSMFFVETFEINMRGDRFPRYKSLNQFNSITYPSAKGYSVVTEKKDGKRRRFLRLGKIPGLIRCYNQSTDIEGNLKTCTIKRKDMGSHSVYYASIAYEPPSEPYREPLKGPVGIDIGISNIVAFSDGEKVKNDHIFLHLASKLRKLQQRLSRLSPDTKMYGKIQTRINHLYEKIRNHRKNKVETISAHIVRDYGPIVMEDLSVMQIRRRTISRYMTNGYNDASLGYLRRRIQDKASSAGREMILVDPKGTSQTCSMCGNTVNKDLSIRVHECPYCKTSMDRDVNAARNILFRSGLVPAPWVDRPPASRA
ncbi:MAG: transposase, partial [Candidatus Methanomethylophilaceae archaeon]|nr:transposase [Candidatus Methanomethylophilaceae archaeon]